MNNKDASKFRLIHIDWARGLAVILMIQTHAIDAWLAPQYRLYAFFGKSQLLGGFPAPAFLFLAGLAMALGYGKVDNSDMTLLPKLWLSVKRGLQVLGLAVLFRLQEFVQWTEWRQWHKMFKVDILNTIGVSLMALGLLFWAVRSNRWRLVLLLAGASALAAFTPLVQNSTTVKSLPWLLGEYLGRRFDYGYFPIFPWLAFAFGGAAVGLLTAEYKQDRNKSIFLNLGLAVLAWVLIIGGNLWAKHVPHGAGWSFWRNSPEYAVIRIGIQILVLSGSFMLCLLFKPRSFSLMRLLGRHSLLVYWVHITLVYGRPLYFLKLELDPRQSLLGVALLTAAMLGLAWLAENWKGLYERTSRVPRSSAI
ncbi:MAG: heparan-alpha-glucosaminide N-acetyltransferase domain-containing protein [bacterium]|nr:heparan-alpha-glucosaminide N-acetyltransferase domain-containing protein [bacterium]